MKTMKDIERTCDLRDSIKKPDRHLGANIAECELPDGRICWSMSGKDYVKNSVNLVKEILAKNNEQLTTSSRATERPFPKDYRPEVDVSSELDAKDTNLFQQLIGMLRWAVELGRVDIAFEVSLLSSHLALPREGHLQAAFSIFGHLNKHLDSDLVLDPMLIDLDDECFQRTDWSRSVYGDVQEELPPDRPTPLGKSMRMTCFVDASHARDLVTRRSHTGYVIHLNNAVICWFSKKQNTVESSTFGSELVALRIAKEKCQALRTKLRLMGIPVDEPSFVLCDNDSVVKSTTRAEARLQKKHNAICWHAVRESCAAGWLMVGKEPTQSNTADLLTKQLDLDARRKFLRSIFIKGVRIIGPEELEEQLNGDSS